jgi:hypothetical protein
MILQEHAEVTERPVFSASSATSCEMLLPLFEESRTSHDFTGARCGHRGSCILCFLCDLLLTAFAALRRIQNFTCFTGARRGHRGSSILCFLCDLLLNASAALRKIQNLTCFYMSTQRSPRVLYSLLPLRPPVNRFCRSSKNPELHMFYRSTQRSQRVQYPLLRLRPPVKCFCRSSKNPKPHMFLQEYAVVTDRPVFSASSAAFCAAVRRRKNSRHR